MPSQICEQAISDSLHCGKAVLKFISPNDVGLTASHQYGIYLPLNAWKYFTPYEPKRGINYDHHIKLVWQDGRVTESIVKWYGVRTRYEYRLTRFGRNFPFRSSDYVGNLLVMIPERIDRFRMYVLDSEDDIEEIQAALGLRIRMGEGAIFDPSVMPLFESENACINRHFQEFSDVLSSFPPTISFSEYVRKTLVDCISSFPSLQPDEQLIRCIDAEYELFRIVEKKICGPEVIRKFRSLDEFLGIAQTILQRRKARAGRSLEHHVSFLLKDSGIPFDFGMDVEGTKPDILIPGKKEYLDPRYPLKKLFVVGIKTTCKDRWRQVTREATKVESKYILTIQQGISPGQLDEMEKNKVKLVVPSGLHKAYPPEYRSRLLGFGDFVQVIRSALEV